MDRSPVFHAARPLLTRFLSEEDGAATIWSLFFFFMFMIVGGVALDFALGERSRTHMQVTADASAHAASLALPDPVAAASAASAMETLNAPSPDFGDVIRAGDIEIGRWNSVTRSLETGVRAPSAVRVTARRHADNPVETLLLRFVGLSSLQVAAQATSIALPPSCSDGGFFTESWIISGSNNTYVDGFCLYGRQGVKIGSTNSFEAGTFIGMENLADFVQSSDNAGVADALQEGTATLTLPDLVPGIVSDMKAGNLSGLPDFITSGPVFLTEIIQDTVLSSGTLYVVDQVADLGSDVTVENVAIVAGKEVKTGSNVVMRNVVLATTDKILFGSTNDFGTDDYCGTGEYSVYAFAGDNIEFGSQSLIRAMQMASRGMIKLGSELRAVEGVYGEALLDFDYGSADVYGGCPTGLMSTVEATMMVGASRLVQ